MTALREDPRTFDYSHVVAILSGGPRQLTAGQIAELLGRSRQWVWERLNAAEVDGALIRDPYAGNKSDLWSLVDRT